MFQRKRVVVNFDGDSPHVRSRTKQAFKEESNVNNIMAKFGAARVLEHFSQFQGNYGDYSDLPSYQEHCNAVIKAEQMFMTLPAQVRNRFKNDPGLFLDFVSKEENRDEMAKMGLLKEPLPVVQDSKKIEQNSDKKDEQKTPG